MTNNEYAREDHDQIVTETLMANLRRVFGDREIGGVHRPATSRIASH
jgi:hypothetical protein